MKKNYQAWEVDLKDFFKLKNESERIKFFLNFAILAPSSHNSQPWRFGLTDNSISMDLAHERRLLESDQNDRQAFISLGCAIENINIAADYYGYSMSVDFPKEFPFCRLFFSKKATASVFPQDHLVHFIMERVTNRGKYSVRLPNKDFFDRIYKAKSSSIEMSVVTGAKKNDLAKIAVNAGVAAMQNKSFRHELKQYLVPNITNSETGMPGFGLGVPLPFSFLLPTFVKLLNVNKLSCKKDLVLLEHHTPALVVLSSSQDNPIGWVEIGRTYESVALLSVREGIATAMWAAPIQIGTYFQEIIDVLNLSSRPQALFRLGYPKSNVRHSPRIPVEDVVS